MPATVSALFFDLDGTLFDTAGEVNWAANQVLVQWNLPTASLQQTTLLIGKGSRNFVERLLAQQSKRPAEPKLIDDFLVGFEEQYLKITGKMAPLYPGVKEGLAQLHAAGIKLAVITNKQQALAEILLARDGLTPYFQGWIGGDHMVRKKPDPWSLLHMCERLQVPVSETIYVGDSENDVDAARAAGMRSLVVPWGYSGERRFDELGADGVLSSFDELIHLSCNLRRKDIY